MATFIVLALMGIFGFMLGRYTIYRNLKFFNEVYYQPKIKNKTYDDWKNELPSYIGNLLDVAHAFGFDEGISKNLTDSRAGYIIPQKKSDTPRMAENSERMEI